MAPVFLSQQMVEKLSKADSPVELCTSEGLVLGYFTPAKPKQLFESPS